MTTWFMTVDALLRLFCEAETQEEAQRAFGSSRYLLPTRQQVNEHGQPAFDAQGNPLMALTFVEVPPDIDGWLRETPPMNGWTRIPGGWLTHNGEFVPVAGTANSRIIERQLITVPKGTIPHHQGFPNG